MTDLDYHDEGKEGYEALAWLSPLDYSAKQREFERNTAPNTGQWLLNSKEFVDWRSKESHRLWCVGMREYFSIHPSKGSLIDKAKLERERLSWRKLSRLKDRFHSTSNIRRSSIIINHLEEPHFKSNNQEPAVAYLYLTYKDQPSLEHLLGSVAKQLLGSSKELPDSLKRIWDKQPGVSDKNSVRRHHPSLTELDEILVDVTRGRQVYIIVDALDEYAPELRAELVEHLRKIREDINLLVTSRLLEGLDSMAHGFKRLEVAAQSQDIHEYIDHVIKKHHRLQHMVGTDPNLRKDIRHNVTKKSSQMYEPASSQ